MTVLADGGAPGAVAEGGSPGGADGGTPGAAEALLVVVPGLGLDARSWNGVWPHLCGPSTVVTLPSMGRRAAAGVDLSVDALASQLVGRLPGGAELVLAGHSASCQVVVRAAALEPRVTGLLLVGPTTDPSGASWPRTTARWLRTAGHERLFEVGILVPQYRRTGPWTMVRAMDRIRRHRVDLALTDVPVATTTTTIVRGEHDRIAPARWCAELAVCAAGRVLTVPDAGHMVPLTHPQVVARVADDLRRAARRPGAP